jgi:hypothetical protein
VESYQPVTAAVLVYLEFMQGPSLPHSLVEHVTRKPLLQSLPTPSLLVGVSKPTFSGAQGAPTSLLCVFFNSLFIIIIIFFILWGGGQSFQGAMLVYSRSGCGDTMYQLFAHLLVCIHLAG